MRNHSTAKRPLGFFFLPPPPPLALPLPLASLSFPFPLALPVASSLAPLPWGFFSGASSPLCLKSEHSVP